MRPELAATAKQGGRLIILDDIFPQLLSSFRVAEFNAYLETYERAAVYSTATAFCSVGEERSFQEVQAEYARRYPAFNGRVFKFDSRRSWEGELIYFVFLMNAANFMSVLEKSGTPFVFTLYPGGGLLLDQPESEKLLRKVCSLANLRKVITTQKIAHEYLLDKFLDAEQVEFIYGGVFPTRQLIRPDVARKRYRQDKSSFDICFVANKYMSKGIDKGYDVFVAVAHELARRHSDIFFHVIGPFDESDINVTGLKGRIRFYGLRPTDFFPRFYAGMDLILAPNVPFRLRPGAFDGFPTGCCVEAGLCGVAVFCADALNQNIAFKENEEIVIIPHDIQAICELIDKYYNHYDSLLLLARRGQAAFSAVFALEAQMRKRLRVLSEYMPAP